MKNRTLIFALLLSLCLLPGCGGTTVVGVSSTAEEPVKPTPEGGADGERVVTMTCRIVDGAETGELLLADLAAGGGVYSLTLGDGEGKEPLVYLDGEPADSSVLEDGMPVDITQSGPIYVPDPAILSGVERIDAFSLGTERNPGGGYYDLCGFYLQVLDDLWQVDSALNEGKPLAGLDLSRAPGGLTESEQAAIALRFGEEHGVEVITATMEELVEEGYIAADPLGTEGAPTDARFYHWDDGCHFSITPHETEEVYMGLRVLRFDAEKYASSLGAYFFYDCTAVWPQLGTWSGYTIGAEMIS